MKVVLVRLAAVLLVTAPLASADEEVSKVPSVPGPNKALYDYLGDPVATPTNMDAAYTKKGLTSAMQDAAQAANISLTKVEVDDSEFPFLVGVVCANKGAIEKLKEQIRKVAAYNYTGSVGGDSICAMNFVPYSAFPTDARQRIHHGVQVRADTQSPQVKIVARVDNDGQ